jgi:hypothetical protein
MGPAYVLFKAFVSHASSISERFAGQNPEAMIRKGAEKVKLKKNTGDPS